jgi:hypothetical protein
MKFRFPRSLRAIPGFRELFALHEDWHIHQFYRQIGLADAQDRLMDANGPLVAAGPFAGMRYLRSSSGSVLGAKLLGCYEAELHGIISQISGDPPDLFIDVGAAEGYYAVGVASMLKQGKRSGNICKIIAFEANFIARHRLIQLARLNGVQNDLEIAGLASPDSLSRHLQGAKNPILWCDIDGGEYGLLDPTIISGLNKTTIVLETHEAMAGRPVSFILKRFHHSHSLQRIPNQERSAEDWFPPELSSVFSPQEKALLMDEMRPPGNDWVVLRPRLAD